MNHSLNKEANVGEQREEKEEEQQTWAHILFDYLIILLCSECS